MVAPHLAKPHDFATDVVAPAARMRVTDRDAPHGVDLGERTRLSAPSTRC
ncbi:hypothetical protein [Mycobacterium sp. GA-2829]|nr:hypothetical protein [Mycobacterium sp. GA-2829]